MAVGVWYNSIMKVFPVLFVLVLGVGVLGAQSPERSGGEGFSITPPPRGYGSYSRDPAANRHRAELSWHYLETDLYTLQGGSLYITSRLFRRSWGGLSLQYGGFYLQGEETAAIMTKKDGSWGSDQDEETDLRVSGFGVAPTLEVVLWGSTEAGSERSRRAQLLGFAGFDGGHQFFSQDLGEGWENYYSRYAAPLAGVQLHLPLGGLLISPFGMYKHLYGQSLYNGTTHDFDIALASGGVDLLWRGISVSGIVQALDDRSDRTYTLSVGFSF